VLVHRDYKITTKVLCFEKKSVISFKLQKDR
jgi:hypothetical protein